GGVVIEGPGIHPSTNTVLTGNIIGLSANGSPLGNHGAGVLVINSASATIGGTTNGARKHLAGNPGEGNGPIPPGTGTMVEGNYIGVAGDGTKKQANTGNGVRITNASATIGGTATGAGNIISGNGLAGILVNSMGTALIENNYIGVGADGLTAI